MSRPMALAIASTFSCLSASGWRELFASNSLSCISQNLPCFWAAMAAFAAYGASGCMGSGLCLKTKRTSAP